MSSLCILAVNPLTVRWFANISSHSKSRLFIFSLTLSLCKAFYFDVSFVFAFVACTFGIMSKNNICEDQCQGAFPCVFFYLFIVSGLTFKSLIHFEWIFVSGVRQGSSFILLQVVVQFS